MKKKILIFFLMLILSISLSYAIKTMTVDETELVSLKTEAIDEDNDELFYTFTGPVDEKGQWATTYGDAGEYKVTVTVSDGELSASEDILLIVNKKNVKPSIDSFAPEETELTINEGESIDFSIVVFDLNNDPLKYAWKLDGNIVSEGTDYSYKSDYGDAGIHKIVIIISDGEEEQKKEWIINVNKVDRKALLDNINDITAYELDIIKLKLPDFKKYNLEYEISDPIGNENNWETGYDDSGKYVVKITIKDREFIASKSIKVEVIDIDRPPIFKPISNAWLKENQKVVIELEAQDPDDDEIKFSVESLPDGASFDGKKFEFVTDYDTVKKKSTLHKILDKFHILYKPFKVVFTAKSQESEVKQTVFIMIKDVNRAPVLDDLSEIIVNEGEEIILEPKASDADGDNVFYSYSGWIDVDRYLTNYEDSGKYKVKVIASDGFLTDEKFVEITVNDVNRAPIFEDIGYIEINENEKLELPLHISDPEGDSIEITAESLPGNSIIKDKVFIWTPDYDTIKEDLGRFTINFIASDGQDETLQQANITVYNVNRLPKIVSFSPGKNINMNVNKKINLELSAEDEDGDELTYIWDFSLLEKYSAGNAMVRNFTSPGKKKVKVIVSDGKDEIKHEWNINVIGPKKKIMIKTTKKAAQPKVEVKKEPKKKVKIVVKKEVKKATPPPVKKVEPKKGYIYDQYTIVHIEDGPVIDETKEQFVVYR